ncbi:MAG: tail fiber domain-containing protein [Cryomorphaceae bacterium]
MKKITTFFAILFFVSAFGQTIDIGPDEYAFRYSLSNNFGLFFNATDVRYEFLNGSAVPVFGFSAQNGQMTTNIEFNSNSDYLVGNNRYAFRAKSDSDFGLYFNASTLSYDFRDNSANAAFSIGANTGNLTTSGFIAPGNTSSTTEGIIRYNGSDLQGRVDGQWKSLTSQGDSGDTNLQEAYNNGNSMNTSIGVPVAIEGPGGLIVSIDQNMTTEGVGAKMFFDATNSSFRSGSVNATAWNDENRGSGSAAFGLSTIASGIGSFAVGNASEASGARAAAFGIQTIASGETAIASGFNSEASGDYSVAFGESTLASGINAFTANEDNIASGQSSVAFGRNSEASGSFAIAIGNNSLASGSSSIAAGSSADATGTTSAAFGFSTTAQGFGSIVAGWASTAEGDGSVAFGRGTIAKSAHETVIGSFNTDYTANSTTSYDANDRVLTVGNGLGSADRSDAMVVLKNGNIGFGTSEPDYRLEIDGINAGTTGLQLSGSANYYGNNQWQFGQANSGAGGGSLAGDFIFRQGGDTEYVMWTSYFAPGDDGFTDLGRFSYRWNQVYAQNGTINTSDAREKKNIKDVEYGLEEVMAMRPVTYEWKDSDENGTKVGFIAQDLLEIVPEVVVTHERVEDRETGAVTYQEAERMGVFYDDLIPVLAKAIQEQNETIEEVQKENEDLTQENQNLRSELDEVKNRMNRFEQDLVSCCFDSQSGQTNASSTSSDDAELGQNIPNPFSESTVIRYYLPDGIANAIIRITEMGGSPVQDLQLGATRGANQIEFQTQGLAAGTYLYSLFVDGKFVDTKKMMIVR